MSASSSRPAGAVSILRSMAACTCACALAMAVCAGGAAAERPRPAQSSAAQDGQAKPDSQVHVLHAQGNVYMLVEPGQQHHGADRRTSTSSLWTRAFRNTATSDCGDPVALQPADHVHREYQLRRRPHRRQPSSFPRRDGRCRTPAARAWIPPCPRRLSPRSASGKGRRLSGTRTRWIGTATRDWCRLRSPMGARASSSSTASRCSSTTCPRRTPTETRSCFFAARKLSAWAIFFRPPATR